MRRKVRAWVRAHRDEIELFYLPPYAPELNPDEYLNGDLKLGVAARVPARTKP
jgi:transposase